MASVTRLERGAPGLRETTLTHLENLAAAVTPLGLEPTLLAPPRRLPRLQVAHPDGDTEDVYAWRCEDGKWWFWWPWAARISAAGELAEAATEIDRALKRSPGE